MQERKQRMKYRQIGKKERGNKGINKETERKKMQITILIINILRTMCVN
jgi:hypothetical protein